MIDAYREKTAMTPPLQWKQFLQTERPKSMNLRDIFFLEAIDNPENFDKGLKTFFFEKTTTWTHFGVVFSPIGEDSAIRFYRSKSDFREGNEEDRRTLPCLSRLMASSNPCRMQE